MGVMNGAFDWLFQRQQIRAARARIAGRSDWAKLCQARSKACLSLSDSIVDALENASAMAPENLAVCRLACQWILCSDAAGPRPLDQSLAQFDAQILATACGGSGKVEEIRKVLLRTSFDDGGLPAPQIEKDLEALRAFSRSVSDLIDPEQAYQKVVSRAVLRVAALVVILLVIGGGVGYAARGALKRGVSLGGANVSASGGAGAGTFDGVPWRASSKYADCDPAKHTCGGVTTDIFFHTNEDDAPWIEFDLGKPKQIREVRIKNRGDTDPARAVPLVVETSVDQKTWQQAGQRNEPFSEWTATFNPTSARYVRLRVLRKTYFHLEGVWIR